MDWRRRVADGLAGHRPAVRWLGEFIAFGLLEARACIFPAAFFLILIASNHISVPGIARYDLIFVLTLIVQAALLGFRIETKDEVLTLSLFHLIGLALEIFKTHPAIGSWSYPEPGLLKLFGVPLYSGFMYAGVASYLIQAWRLLDVKLTRYPSYWLSLPLAAAIYLNFFTHHFILDLRWWLCAAVFVVFGRCQVYFTVLQKPRRMPLPVAFALIAFFIWVAENIATFWGAWAYPNQVHQWTNVSLGKISSWFLLVIISFIIVADLKHVKARNDDELPAEVSQPERN